jgi:taurine transport system substrate-binding protein
MALPLILFSLLLSSFPFPSSAASAAASSCPPDKTVVRVGYFKEEQPFEVAVAHRWFDTDDECFVFYPQTSGTKAGRKMQNGELQLAAMGSAPFALTLSRGVAVTDFYTLHSKGDSQGLVTHPSSGIYSPADLKGKTVAYPAGSTAHFHSLFIAEVFNIPPTDINWVTLSGGEIMEAWDAGTIDAAFVWGSAYSHIKETGTVLITARSLSSWGKETFNNFVRPSRAKRAREGSGRAPERSPSLLRAAHHHLVLLCEQSGRE